MLKVVVAFTLALAPGSLGAPAADEVKSLPGWDKPLPTKHYSGYIPVNSSTRHMHYYFQMSEGANPAKDPITLWMNGGPGCTSLKGGFEELGQLVFNYHSLDNNDSNPVPTLSYNPYGWTQVSNLLMFESPPGVGFSYCDVCLGNATCKCEADDLSTASDNADAVIGFFTEKFPEFKDNKFFITGESYAGMYIPTLMAELDRRGGVNLVGAAVGNGVGGTDSDTGGDGGRVRALFYYGKGLFPNSLRETIENECGSLYYPTQPGWINKTTACSDALNTMNQNVGPHNFYNLQDFCPTEELGGYTLQEWEASMAPLPDGSLPRMDALLHRNPTTTAAKCADVQGMSPLGVIQQWCGVDRSMFQWLSQPSVVSALHVTTPKGTETNNLKYTGGYRGGDLRSLYKELALKYRLWIYNGQEDGCIPYTGAEEWTSHLGFPIKTSWHPWFGDAAAGGSRVAAGYAVQYDSPARDFQFVTVKGAGHEVPTFKPQAAYTLFTSFINGTAL